MRPFGELGRLALDQARLRVKARAKHPDELWWTAEALEQSTSRVVATWHAQRFAGIGPVLDIGCSVGGDLIALAAVTSAVGVDLDEARLLFARENTGCPVVLADALSLSPSGAVFADPARRFGGRRGFDPASWSPPLSQVLSWPCSALGVKVAPGIDYDLLPSDIEVEVVSLHGDVKEAMLWRGAVQSGVVRSATLLPSGDRLLHEGAAAPAVAVPGSFLLEPDGAVIRAHLVAELAALVDGWLLDATIAYISAAAVTPTPFGRWYEVLEVLPFSLKGVRERLRALDTGTVVIKKRGTAVEPESFRKQLRLTGSQERTLVLTRAAGKQIALIASPVFPL
jgi:SAM-dependent methyltransferase